MPSTPRAFAPTPAVAPIRASAPIRAILVALLACLLVPGVASAAKSATGGAAYVAPTPTPAPVPAPAIAPAMTAPVTGAPVAVPEPGAWTGPEVPGAVAKLLPDGTAAAPALAPPQVKQAIWAANWLQDKPYAYGGGHGGFVDDGYDCSGTVSFALHAAGLLDSPLDSGSFMRWGEKGKGAWFTVYTNPGHAYVVIAGLRLDTSAAGVRITRKVARAATERGPRWRPALRATRGFVKRHPVGF